MTAPVRPKARSDLALVVLDGEAVIYDESNEELHHLNQTATVVLSMCEGNTTIGEMSRELAEAFQMTIEEVEPQVRALIRQLRRAKLLEPSRNGKSHG